MTIDTSTIALAPQAPHVGACDLCARGAADLSATVTVTHASGASVHFTACSFCQRAVRRLSAASGDVLRFADAGTAAPAVMVEAVPGVAVREVVAEEAAVELAGELIYEYADPLQGPDGTLYIPRVYGAQRLDGTWIGWLEFGGIGGGVLRTNRETSQPNRPALVYWSSRLQPSYLEGAFRRAVRPHLVRIV